MDASKDDQDQNPESSGEDGGDANSGSPKATGAGAGGAAEEQLFDDDDAPAQSLDAYGFQVPRLSARHNNRIVGPPPVKYDEIEIGNRITKSKKDNPNHRYGQTPANPKKFYYDQNIHQCNAAKNDPEDLPRDLVDKHKLHPKFGLPLPDSQNPDGPFNDWMDPVKETNPIIFIQNPRPGTDRAREVFRTTRSQWMAKADQKFDASISYNMHVRDVVKGAGDLELPPEPVEPEVPEPPQIIDPSLINAVERAEISRKEEERQAAVAAHHAQFSPPPPPARVNPPTPQRYDPVRDKTYRTPYAPVPPPPAPRGELDLLANAASMHTQLPGPITYNLPPAPYGMQQLLPAPAPQYQSMYGPPPQQQQYQPPRPAPAQGGSGRHRELRPAPPQQRPPPPPPPGPRWY